MALEFSKDSSTVFALDSSRKVRLWDIDTGTLSTEFSVTFEGHPAKMKMHPTERSIAIGDALGSIRLFDITTGRILQSFSSYGTGVRQIAFSRDGRTLLAALGNFKGEADARGEVRFWDLETGQLIIRLGQDLAPCVGVVLSESQWQLTTVHFDGQILIWEGATDEEVDQQRTRASSSEADLSSTEPA
jgi:WD40 repeat protein